MKRLTCLASILLIVLLFPAHAQSKLQVTKSLGDPLNITWNFPTTEEINIDNFVVENCTDINTGCTDLGTVAKNLRVFSTVITATTKLFFQVRTVKGTNRSAPSNPVAIDILIRAPVSAGAN